MSGAEKEKEKGVLACLLQVSGSCFLFLLCGKVALNKLLLVKYIELVDNQFRVFCNRKTDMFT